MWTYVCALLFSIVIGPAPAGRAERVHIHDGNRRSDVVAIDLCLSGNHSSYSSNWIVGQPLWVLSFESGYSLAAAQIRESNTAWPVVGLREQFFFPSPVDTRLVVRAMGQVCDSTIKSSNSKKRCILLKSCDISGIRISASVVKNSSESSFQFGGRQICRIEDGTGSINRIGDYVPCVEVGGLVLAEARKEHVVPPHLVNFALNIEDGGQIRTRSFTLPISAKNDSGRRPNSNGTSAAEDARKHKTNHGRYLRRNDTGLTAVWVQEGAVVEDISDEDLDVSYDGRKWFHLLGPICLRKCPLFKGK